MRKICWALSLLAVVGVAGAARIPGGAENPRITSTYERYLKTAWQKGRITAFAYYSGLYWDPAQHRWVVKNELAPEVKQSMAHAASNTATVARIAVNMARAYTDTSIMDEMSLFYLEFYHRYFMTLGALRKTESPKIKNKALGPERGPDSVRTLPWYWPQADGSVTLAECYLCNAEYFEPAAGLVKAIAQLPEKSRTTAMTTFVMEYVPLMASEHVLRGLHDQRRVADMDPSDKVHYKKWGMLDDEVITLAIASELLGAHRADPELVKLSESDLDRLREYVRQNVEWLIFSRTETSDSTGRVYASYFNGDWDAVDDGLDFSGYEGQAFPTDTNKAAGKGKSWDISHFSRVPRTFKALWDNVSTTGVNFPQRKDILAIGNQYAYKVFEGDFTRPLFNNFFDGSDGWYRVGYSGRDHYGYAPARYCNMADTTHACTAIAGIYGWSLLAGISQDVARVQQALLDLAWGKDKSVSCFEASCFREMHYRYAEASFSFVDSQGNEQYPLALLTLVSELELVAEKNKQSSKLDSR
jgi:hypothetical protein